MAIELAPLPLPPSADASKFKDFGREVKGIDPGNLSTEQLEEIKQLLYKACRFRFIRAKIYLTE
jgi:xanthine dioxygenase